MIDNDLMVVKEYCKNKKSILKKTLFVIRVKSR